MSTKASTTSLSSSTSSSRTTSPSSSSTRTSTSSTCPEPQPTCTDSCLTSNVLGGQAAQAVPGPYKSIGFLRGITAGMDWAECALNATNNYLWCNNRYMITPVSPSAGQAGQVGTTNETNPSRTSTERPLICGLTGQNLGCKIGAPIASPSATASAWATFYARATAPTAACQNKVLHIFASLPSASAVAYQLLGNLSLSPPLP